MGRILIHRRDSDYRVVKGSEISANVYNLVIRLKSEFCDV